MSRTEAKKKFLDFIKKWPIYGATFFRALQISRISKNPPEVCRDGSQTKHSFRTVFTICVYYFETRILMFSVIAGRFVVRV
jgi:hypothetical protein